MLGFKNLNEIYLRGALFRKKYIKNLSSVFLGFDVDFFIGFDQSILRHDERSSLLRWLVDLMEDTPQKIVMNTHVNFNFDFEFMTSDINFLQFYGCIENIPGLNVKEMRHRRADYFLDSSMLCAFINSIMVKNERSAISLTHLSKEDLRFIQWNFMEINDSFFLELRIYFKELARYRKDFSLKYSPLWDFLVQLGINKNEGIQIPSYNKLGLYLSLYHNGIMDVFAKDGKFFDVYIKNLHWNGLSHRLPMSVRAVQYSDFKWQEQVCVENAFETADSFQLCLDDYFYFLSNGNAQQMLVNKDIVLFLSSIKDDMYMQDVNLIDPDLLVVTDGYGSGGNNYLLNKFGLVSQNLEIFKDVSITNEDFGDFVNSAYFLRKNNGIFRVFVSSNLIFFNLMGGVNNTDNFSNLYSRLLVFFKYYFLWHLPGISYETEFFSLIHLGLKRDIFDLFFPQMEYRFLLAKYQGMLDLLTMRVYVQANDRFYKQVGRHVGKGVIEQEWTSIRFIDDAFRKVNVTGMERPFNWVDYSEFGLSMFFYNLTHLRSLWFHIFQMPLQFFGPRFLSHVNAQLGLSILKSKQGLKEIREDQNVPLMMNLLIDRYFLVDDLKYNKSLYVYLMREYGNSSQRNFIVNDLIFHDGLLTASESQESFQTQWSLKYKHVLYFFSFFKKLGGLNFFRTDSYFISRSTLLNKFGLVDELGLRDAEVRQASKLRLNVGFKLGSSLSHTYFFLFQSPVDFQEVCSYLVGSWKRGIQDKYVGTNPLQFPQYTKETSLELYPDPLHQRLTEDFLFLILEGFGDIVVYKSIFFVDHEINSSYVREPLNLDDYNVSFFLFDSDRTHISKRPTGTLFERVSAVGHALLEREWVYDISILNRSEVVDWYYDRYSDLYRERIFSEVSVLSPVWDNVSGARYSNMLNLLAKSYSRFIYLSKINNVIGPLDRKGYEALQISLSQFSWAGLLSLVVLEDFQETSKFLENDQFLGFLKLVFKQMGDFANFLLISNMHRFSDSREASGLLEHEDNGMGLFIIYDWLFLFNFCQGVMHSSFDKPVFNLEERNSFLFWVLLLENVLFFRLWLAFLVFNEKTTHFRYLY